MISRGAFQPTLFHHFMIRWCLWVYHEDYTSLLPWTLTRRNHRVPERSLCFMMMEAIEIDVQISHFALLDFHYACNWNFKHHTAFAEVFLTLVKHQNLNISWVIYTEVVPSELFKEVSKYDLKALINSENTWLTKRYVPQYSPILFCRLKSFEPWLSSGPTNVRLCCL